MRRRHILVNLAMLLGAFGFLGYIFIVIAGFLGCCADINSKVYSNLVIIILIVAFVLFAICMYNNYCKIPHENEEKKK